jgi:hypothetical protein
VVKKHLIKGICSLLFLLAMLALETSPAMAASTWQQVGGELPGIPTSLFLYNGTPYVTCTDASSKATVLEYNGTSWQPVGNPGFSSGPTDWVSLFVYDGTPYVAYRDVANDYKFTVNEYDGRVWTPVGTPFEMDGLGSGTMYNSFYVYQGTPYVADIDVTDGRVVVMKYTGDSAGWQPVGSTIDYTGNWRELYGDYPGFLSPLSLVVYEGTPYVAVRNTVMKYDGTAWEPVGSASFLGINTDYESLYVYNGIPYVSYQSQVGGSGTISGVPEGSITSGVMEYNGAAWVSVGNSFDNSGILCESLSVYGGTPYVTCKDADGKATVLEYDGTSWQPVGGPGFSSARVDNEYLSIDDGTPFLAYDYIDANGNYHGAVMEYTGPPAITTPVYAGTDASVSGTAAPGATIQLSVNGTEQPAVMADADSGDWTVDGLTLHPGDTVSVTASAPAGSISQTATALVVAASTLIAIQVNINGSSLQIDVPPLIINGRVMVPLRAILEALGATVQWNPNDQSIVATKGSTIIKLQIGSTTASTNGTQVTLDAAPQIEGGRTLVPVRFVSEALGAQVNWDAANRRVNIVTMSS